MHACILKGNPGQTHTQQMDCCSHNSLLCASVVLGLAVAVSFVSTGVACYGCYVISCLFFHVMLFFPLRTPFA